MRLPIRSLATLLVAVGVATCADAPTVSRAHPAVTGKGVVAISPVFSKEAQALYAQRATNAALSFDHVRIVLVSPPADTVKDTTIVFNPASPPQTVELVVSVTSTNEVFNGEVDYTNNGAIVYQGISKFTAYPPDQPPPPSGQGLVIVYVGPGATATKLSVTPKSVNVVAPGSAAFSVVATDANNAPVPGVPIMWSSSDPSVATVDATSGAVATTGKRGTATITASAPTKAGVISDNGGVVVTLPAASIALVSGGGQSGKAGTSLGAAAVVRVLASDGIGVSGVTVNFAAPAGGKVGTSSVTTDPTGLASTSLTLGGVAGPQSFAASAAGFSVSISATATPGDPAIVVAVSGGGQQDTIKHALKAPLTARVTDAFANPVGGVSVVWSVASGSGTLSAQATTTASDGSTSVGYTLGGAVANETINASVSGIPGVASFTVSAIATGPANIAAVSGSGQSGRVQQALASPFVVMVTDQAGNPVNGAQVSWAASNGTISGTTTTGVTGQTSNTLTLGNAVGAASATASISNGKSVSFTATVSPGIVAQLNFRAPPPNGTPGALLAPPILVELRDAAGNLTAAANPVTVAFGANPVNATLGGTLTRTSAAGVASFNDLTVSAAANGYTLVATSAGVPPATSAPFNITGQTGGAPFRLALVTPPPANNFSGIPLAQQPVIQVQDQAGNPVAAATNVTATFSAGSERNNFLPTNPQTGSVAFTNLIYTGNASGNAVFSAPGLQSVQVPVSVAQTLLAFQTQPSTVTAGIVMTPPVVVQILNQAGGVIAAANGVVVTMGIASNPGQGTLSGVVAVPVTNGVASFPTLSINNAGVGYTLQASAIGITSATSASFDVLPQSTGQQTLWTGSVSNVWTVAGNWSSVVPGALDDVIIPSGAPNQPVISAGTAVKSITVNSGASLTVGSVALTLTVGAGGISNSGTLNLNGTTLLGALNNLGTTVTQGSTQLNGAVTTGAGSTLVAQGINTFGAALLTVANGFTNNGAIQLTDLVAGYGATLTVTSGVLTNAPGGSIASLAGFNGPRGITGIFDNQGTIAVNNAQGMAMSASTGNSNNSGTITVTGTTLALSLTGTAAFTSTGTMSIGTGGRFVEIGGVFDISVGVVNGPGQMLVSNGTMRFTPSAITAPLSINNETISPNNITIPSGTTLELFNSTVAAPVTNNGLLLVHGSTSLSTLLTGSGSITRVEGINTYGGATLTVANGVTNTATIELTDAVAGYGATFGVSSGTFVNNAGATLSILQGSNGPRTIAAELDNQGTITIGNTQGLTLGRAGATNRNSGTIAIAGSNVTVNQTGASPSFINTGSITIAAARTLTVNGGLLDLSAGTVTGAGILAVNNGSLAFTTTTMTTPLTLTNTTIVGGTVTIPNGQTLELVSGTMSAAVVNQGLLLIHGSAALSGALTTGANSIVRIEGINTYGGATLTVANGFTNTATIELTDQVAGYGATLAVTNGTLTSSAAGTLSILQGTNGPRTIAAEIANQGTLTIANTQGLTMGRAGAVSTNSGTVAVTSGNLTINQTGTTPSFTNTGSIALSVGRTLTVNGGSLNLGAGTTTGGGILAVNNATLAFNTTTVTTPLTLTNTTIAGGPFTIPTGQQLELVGGTWSAPLTNQGLLLVHGSASMTGALTTTSGAIVRIEGINTYGGATFTVANGFTNVNGSTIELTDQVAGYGATLGVTAGTFVNASGATLSILQGTNGPRTLAAELNNQGTLTIGNTQGLTIGGRSGAAHTNGGTIAVTAGNLTVTQTGTTPSFTNTGTVNVAVGRTWTVSGGTLDLSAGSTTGGGILSVNSSTLAFSTTTVTTPLTLNNTTIAGGTVTIPSGQQLELVNGTLTAALVNQGLFLVHGNVALSGALTTASGSTVRIQGINTYGGAALTVANGFTNVNGSTIELTDAVAGYGATLHVTAGTLTNVAGASLSILQGTNGPRTIDAQLDNQGTLTVGNTQGLTLAHAGAAHTNSGTINVTTGDLTLNQVGATGTFTNTGSIAIGAGRTFTMAGSVGGGGTLDLSAGTVSGLGTLAASNLTIAFTPLTVTTICAFTNVSILGGTLTVPVGQTLTLANTTFNSPIVNNGLVLIHGTVNLAGAYTSGANSTLRIEGINTYGGANAVFANGFTNTATIELTDQVAGYGATLTVTNGTLVNASGATLSILQGTNGPRTIAAELNNQATLNIANSTGLTIARAGSAHINTGTISVGGGGLTVNQSGTTPTFTNANGGVITVAGGTNWTVSGGTLDVSTGSVNGGGGLIVNNATLTFSTSTMGLPLTLTNTTITGGTFTIPNGQSLTLANGTMTAPVVNNGLLLIRGSVSLTGALTTGSGSILRIDGINTYGGAVATFANGFTNSAAIELMDHVAGYGATLAVTAGTLTNAASGTITAFQGSNGPRTLTAQLDNQGTLAVSTSLGLTINKANATHTNSAVINLTTGDLVVSGGTPSFTNSGTITVASGRTFLQTAGTLTNAGVIQGPGTLAAAGVSFINNATLNIQNATTAGSMTVNTGYTQSGAGSVLNIKLGGTAASAIFDRLIVNGTATLGGTLNVTLFNGFSAVSGNTYTIMTYTGLPVGNFSTINLPAGCTANPISGQYQIVC